MTDYLLASDKVESIKKKAEQKYKKFEEEQLKYARRELVTYHDVLLECTAYLKALNDIELLTEDFGEVLSNMTDRIINEQKKICLERG